MRLAATENEILVASRANVFQPSTILPSTMRAMVVPHLKPLAHDGVRRGTHDDLRHLSRQPEPLNP